jgi:hypothetical protein
MRGLTSPCWVVPRTPQIKLASEFIVPLMRNEFCQTPSSGLTISMGYAVNANHRPGRDAVAQSLTADRNGQNDAVSFVTYRNRMKLLVRLKLIAFV